MLRDEYLRRLIDASPIELYLSANDGTRIYWPWRMQPPKEANSSYRNACEQYIIDSDPWDDSVGVDEILNTAHELNADVASLVDVYRDQPATVDSLQHGLSRYQDHPYDGDLLLPLQAPYVECWQQLDRPTTHWLGIGGLKDGTTSERITAAKRLRAAVGSDVRIHGFGWGIDDRLASAIRAEPGLLDSVDSSSAIQSVTYDHLNGEESMSVVAMQAATHLITDLRKCTDYIAEETNQKALEAYQ